MKHLDQIRSILYIGLFLFCFTQINNIQTQTTFKMPSRPYGVSIVDYDLDGDNDVIVGSSDPGFTDPDSIVIMFNDGWGNFTMQGFEANSGLLIFCADMTNDGYPDIISRSFDSIFFHENDKQGGLGDLHLIYNAIGNPRIGGISDMDTNNYLDIVFYNLQYPYGWGVIYNHGNYNFENGYFQHSDSDGWLRSSLGDLNMDDIDDVIVTSNVSESGAYVMLNHISNFEKQSLLQEGWNDGYIIDIDNNDTNDICLFERAGSILGTSKSLLFENNIDSYDFIDSAFFIGGGGIGCFADFNLDGYPDIGMEVSSWISDPAEDSVYIYKNDKNWGFRLLHKHYIGEWFFPELFSGDLNMDGYSDIVVVGYLNPTDDHIQILWNDGTGHFIDTNSVYVHQKEIGFVEYVNIYPNPTQSTVCIDFSIELKNHQSSIEILNIHGLTKLKFSTVLSSNKIDISKFEPGVYIIKIKSGQKTTVKRIIKQ